MSVWTPVNKARVNICDTLLSGDQHGPSTRVSFFRRRMSKNDARVDGPCSRPGREHGYCVPSFKHRRRLIQSGEAERDHFGRLGVRTRHVAIYIYIYNLWAYTYVSGEAEARFEA